jgi:glycosyltransferase involved in cell wall biosynthesis
MRDGSLAEDHDTVSENSAALFQNRRKILVFVWENFGPMHDDRCAAVAHAEPGARVIGLQFTARSEAYDWQPRAGEGFEKITLLEKTDASLIGIIACAVKLIRTCMKLDATHVFFCHYERPAIAIAALILRILGKRIFLLYDSKFDDYPRYIRREFLKSFWLWPYRGAVVASGRTKDYLRFLGMRLETIQFGYNTISLARIRQDAGVSPAPGGCAFQMRHFTIVARLIEKKNLETVLKAYALYAQSCENPRALRLFGAGPLEATLREDVRRENIEHLVRFEGFQQADAIGKALGSSLALLLLSKEEQFGFAIIEALAMGVPVLISPACGAHDEFVRDSVNGFVVEADNPRGMAFFMDLLARDELLWRKMAEAALASAQRADASEFAKAVSALTYV